jgi:hypothetical protein
VTLEQACEVLFERLDVIADLRAKITQLLACSRDRREHHLAFDACLLHGRGQVRSELLVPRLG